MLCSIGRQFSDWSSEYKLFSLERFDRDALFGAVRREVADEIGPSAPFIASMDDTGLKKTGTKIPGVSYRRDPMSPPFSVNFIRAQRFVQMSACVPMGRGAAPAKSIPIDYVHAPTPKKPRKPTPEQVLEYKAASEKMKLSKVGAARIAKLRNDLDEDERGRERKLWVSVDGSYTNATVLKSLPERTGLIGRIRGDAKLYRPPIPKEAGAKGRKKWYGERVPTPEEIRLDDSIPWTTVNVFAAGKIHETRIKAVAPLLWRAAGYDKPLMLIVISPLAYRLRKKSKLLYRQPAYLICTDLESMPEKTVQAYFWRWGIEVNHRDEKQIIGVGEAQLTSEGGANHAPEFFVAVYSMFLLAGLRAFRDADSAPDLLPQPKWRRNDKKSTPSTQDLIAQIRSDLWKSHLDRPHFSGFATPYRSNAKPKKFTPRLADSVLYAVK